MEGLWVMANAEREPVTGSGDGAPNRSRGIAPSERVKEAKPPESKSIKAVVRLKEGPRLCCQYAKTV